MADTAVVNEALRLLEALGGVRDRVESELPVLVDLAFPQGDPGFRSGGFLTRSIIKDGGGDATVDPVALAVQGERERALEAGARAVSKLDRSGNAAQLDDEETEGLEALINLTVRPAIRIVDGSFLPPAPPWEDLEQFRDGIEKIARSVGRVQVTGNPLLPFAGTGSVVAPGVVMTNRHVAKVFASREGDNWVFDPGVTAGLDWADDPDAAGDDTGDTQFTVTKVIGVHPKFDLALLGVESPAGATAPEPVRLASESMDPLERRRIFVVGYPALDPRNGAEAMRRIFGDVYNVKRLQPGEIMIVPPDLGIFHHDCSTLGGNSGSCVIDLDSNLVLGLHFAGKYLKSNKAVALWQLKDDPMLTAAGVNFD